MSTPVLQVELSAGYGSRTVLDDLRFDLEAGQALGFVGASGAGKSTLAMALLGLLGWRGGWVRGKVLLEGTDLLSLNDRQARPLRGSRIALVPQSPMSALNSAVSLRAHFNEAWKAHNLGGSAALDARLAELFPDLQLPADREFLERRPGAISVGQAQRVLIAMALLHRPALLIADEPTSALDPVTQAELLKLLSRLNHSTGTALLYISHDLLSVIQLCDEVAVLERGSLAERVPVSMVRQGEGNTVALRTLLAALPVAPDQIFRLNDRARAGP